MTSLPADALLARLSTTGLQNLQRVVAIDSQSDEKSTTIPSSEGQRHLSAELASFFAGLGFAAVSDAHANLIVRIPATTGHEARAPLALLVHMDTAHGTHAVPHLHVIRGWRGDRVPYPKNPHIHVDVDAYPMLQAFVGDDLVHGDGDYAFGLDDKLGMAELMTLAQLLHDEPTRAHGELLLVFRPDEEIGRMEAIHGLAAELARRGVTAGYTVDGLLPFEVNVENFDAARARVHIADVDAPLSPRGPGVPRLALRLCIHGVNTHGATAHSEGYLNATTVFSRALAGLPVDPVSFVSDGDQECNAVVEVVGGAATRDARDDLERGLVAALSREVSPAQRRGARIEILSRAEVDIDVAGNAARRVLALLSAFFTTPGPQPLLSEDSDGHQGYSNPHRVVVDGDGVGVDFRLRDFTTQALAARAAHVVACASSVGLTAVVEQQYVNMGATLARFPAVPALAEEAGRVAGVACVRRPIRGGTGVDPFLAHGIPIANLGTGYFAPESEKELTSAQNIGRHVLWLAALVEVAAHA